MKEANIFERIIYWFKYFGWAKPAPFNYLSAIFHPIKFFKCLRYPFLKCYHRWNGKFMGYSITEDESIYYGWYKAFGKDLLREISKAGKASRKRLGKHVSWKKLIIWEQIKEKYGTLRLYAAATEEILNVLEKYEFLSQFYCFECGKKAKYQSQGWIEYYCEDCFEKMYRLSENATEKGLLKYKRECLLKYPRDLPSVTTYSKRQEFDNKSDFDKAYKEQSKLNNVEKYGKVKNDNKITWYIEYKNRIEYKVDLEKKYGINFKELTQ